MLTISAATPAAADDDSSTPSAPAGEFVASMSSSTSSTYREADGSFTTQAFTTPVNYQDDGEWTPIDNTLVDAPGETYAVQNAANDYTALIPNDPATTPVKFAVGDSWVTMRLHGVDDTPEVDGAQAEYSEVQNADSVQYLATAIGLKENITLQDAPASAVGYTYTIDASPDLTPVVTSDHAISFQNADDQTVVSVPAGVMSDASDEESDAVSYALVRANQGWKLTVTPDFDWLSDSTRAYPVVIDPSLTNQPVSRDCFIGSSSPDGHHCTNGTVYIKTGREDSSHKYRGLVDFDVSGIPNTATVSSASASLYLDSTQTYSAVSADYGFFASGKTFDNTATWNSSGANGAWAGGDPTGSVYGTTTIVGNTSGYKVFNGLAGLIQTWVTGTAPERGLVLKQIGENSNNTLSFFSSSTSTSNNNKRPYLNVSYTVPTVDGEAADDEGAGTPILSVTTPAGNATTGSTTSQTTTIPGCTPTADNNNCEMTLTVSDDPDQTLFADDASSAVASGVDSGALPSSTTMSGKYYCLPTGCYKKVIAKSWVHHLCFGPCSANQATQSGVFYRTPDGSYVWETVSHAGVIGSHSCRVDHTIGVGMSPGKDDYCTAPRYGNSSIHSHYWLRVTAAWVASELFLGSARHYGDGSTSYKTYSY